MRKGQKYSLSIFAYRSTYLAKCLLSQNTFVTNRLFGAQFTIICLLLLVSRNLASHECKNDKCFPPVQKFSLLAIAVHTPLLKQLNLSTIWTVSQWYGHQTFDQLLNVTKRHVAPDVWQYVLLDVDQGQGEERLSINQICVLLLGSKLPVDELKGVKARASKLYRIIGLWLDHVGRRSIIEINSLDMVLQIRVLQ